MTSTFHKQAEIRLAAEALYETGPDWVTFYREILGLHGIIRRKYRTMEALTEFEQTETYREIQHMLMELRKRAGGDAPQNEPTRVITVRIPKSLHDALRIEAYDLRTSMNKLCITKLIQFIDTELVPKETENLDNL